MISRKATRIELNIEDIEEYEQLKREQTQEYNQMLRMNAQTTPKEGMNIEKKLPLVNTSNPSNTNTKSPSTAQRIGFD
ncbi:subunit of anaphase promoting complex [Heterostelium album PN500]|uniref:Subunit of anaphase promoting complex n=1 Tax=Heterostelium pallidum (strain ATCC 26659 / Pp 5 / PN500) TaxID=670386 RepID=D3BU75_HETP5|nr:subunit of anaphase promoting complex [Heterostelium album PN500]EFA75009.1 subunit of anaphase promoting complex [Heterostelium album PN500]|eukprot:XP_020427143.1 subunit of anaphase promoting complex [Heterostelium album PN500]